VRVTHIARSAGTVFAVLAVLPLLLALSLAGGADPEFEKTRGAAAGKAPDRLVSLAPSITETVFALGLGDGLVGVSRFCRWPEEARRLPRVGGYLDPSYEALVTLRPDLVLLLREHDRVAGNLAALEIPALAVDHTTLEGILVSFALLGRRLGAPRRGDSLEAAARERIRCVRERVAGLPRTRVMVCVGRNPDPGPPSGVYAVGMGSYLGELVEAAGGRNVFGEGLPALPAVSAEGILRRDPELVLELAAGEAAGGRDASELRNDWLVLKDLSAVRAGRIHVLPEAWLTVPGPRVSEVLLRLASLIHPEIDWTEACPEP